MVVGYLRVSTGKQHPVNQKDEIERFAAQKNIIVDRFVIEVASGNKCEKDRKLGRLLKVMKSGDTLIVTEISRLSRTLTEIMAIMGKCFDKGIRLYSTKEGYTFDNTITSVRRIILLSTRDSVELTLRFLRNLFTDLPTDSFHESSKRGSSLKFTTFFSSNSRYKVSIRRSASCEDHKDYPDYDEV